MFQGGGAKDRRPPHLYAYVNRQHLGLPGVLGELAERVLDHLAVEDKGRWHDQLAPAAHHSYKKDVRR